MNRWILLCGVLLAATALFAQDQTMVIKVKQGYAVINKGKNDGLTSGDRLRLHAPDDSRTYGEVQVIKAMNSVAAVKLVKGTPGYTLKVGDVEGSSGFNDESMIVDDLLYDASAPQTQRNRYTEPQSRRKTRKDRKGFIIGGGIGVGGLSMTASAGGLSATETRGVFQTDFKIGYAPSNTLEIYYISKVAWWGESDVTLIQGLSSIGLSNYLNRQTETGVFLTGGVGISTFDAPFEDVAASNGFGLFGGVGYEFAPHWTVQGDLLYSSITEAGVKLSSVGVRVGIQVLGY